MAVLGNVHPITIGNFDIFSWRHFSAFLLLIDTATQEVPMKNILKKLSVQFLRYTIELLHVAQVTNDAKWRPIVITFGTLIENVSRTGLYDCHIF